MSVIEIPQGERGVVRVFALSMDTEKAKALREQKDQASDVATGPNPVEEALGVSGLNTDFVEIFPLSDIQEIGLVGYLEQGNGIEPAQLDPDRGKLAALEGWVMVVYSAAFSGRGAKLKTAPEVTLIGTYAEPGVDWADKTRLKTTASARNAPQGPARKKPSDAAMSGRVAMIALLVLFALTAVVVWIAA